MNQENNTPDPNDQRKQLEEKILADHPRLSLTDTFKFACHPGVSCFNHCCVDVNIFLSPYDVLRMKNRLGITSTEFLDKYTMMPIQKDMKTPVVMLRMSEDDKKQCPFVDTEKGCTIYADRPWPCRMYPLGLASPNEDNKEDAFFFLLKEDVCQGHNCDKQMSVGEWISNQEIEDYNELGELYKQVALHPRILKGKALEVKQLDMFFLSCYDLDRFRRFIFDTKFFSQFEIEAELIEKLRKDDVELLKFGFRWINFFLLKEKSLTMKNEVVKDRMDQLG
jgi:uncharacterized protein